MKIPRGKDGRFLKGFSYNPDTQFKKGQHININTEIKKGQHLSPNTEFKKMHKLWDNPEKKEQLILRLKKRNKYNFTKERLYNLYIIKKLSLEKIAKINNCPLQTISYNLKRFGIPTRSISDALKGKKLPRKRVKQIKEFMIRWHKENNNTQKYREMRKKISKSNKGKIFSKETLEKMRIANLGKKLSKKTRLKISKSNKGKIMPKKTNLQKKNMSINQKRLWQNKDYREKQLNSIFKGFLIIPNKPEKQIIKFIRQNKFPLKYVGNGKIWFKGKNYSFNPDFIGINGKKLIIELYGNYWHNLKTRNWRDNERIKTYKQYGYRTLVIWENELKNEVNVINKIKNAI